MRSDHIIKSFTYSARDLNMLISYVQYKESHLNKETIQGEFRQLLWELELPVNEWYLFG